MYVQVCTHAHTDGFKTANSVFYTHLSQQQRQCPLHVGMPISQHPQLFGEVVSRGCKLGLPLELFQAFVRELYILGSATAAGHDSSPFIKKVKCEYNVLFYSFKLIFGRNIVLSYLWVDVGSTVAFLCLDVE